MPVVSVGGNISYIPGTPSTITASISDSLVVIIILYMFIVLQESDYWRLSL